MLSSGRDDDVQCVGVGQMQVDFGLFDRRDVVDPGEGAIRAIQVRRRPGQHDVMQRVIGFDRQ